MKILFVRCVLMLCLLGSIVGRSEADAGQIFYNQNFIDDLYKSIDIDNPDLVFDAVFFDLENTVTVYPTENYFYWSFYNKGKAIWGNFRLDVLDRDSGVIHLGYFEYDENGVFQDQAGYEKSYSLSDGVNVKKVSEFSYAVSYKGKTVLFQLNDVGMQPPELAELTDDERYVGPIFDESGLKFFLFFDENSKHFFYVLNEDDSYPESFSEYSEGVVLGRRTGFVFYQQEVLNRKILIAVNGKHIERNHYYDGPFDQLPDNYADHTNLKSYIELAYSYTKNKIDKYGTYLADTSTRVLITPYYVYYDLDELSYIDNCSVGAADFISCIAYDPNAFVEN